MVEANLVRRVRSLLEKSERPVSFSGAGLSAESGIPVFRRNSSSDVADLQGENQPLWEKFDPQQLASQAGFSANPDLVLDWYAWRRSELARARPNPAHNALVQMSSMLHVTQNVDNLLERAGASPANVVHLHGQLVHNHCNAACGFNEEITLSDDPAQNKCIAACPDCGAPVRPGVVWFGEALPEDEWQRSIQAVTDCDLLLVVGTSASVYPAAGLIDLAKEGGAMVVTVDPEPAGRGEISNDGEAATAQSEIVLKGQAGDILPELVS